VEAGTMICNSTRQRTDRRTPHQRFLRQQLKGRSLHDAVYQAADEFFCFRYRSKHSMALWTETARAWLGIATFLHWALWDANINIPWTVAQADGVPKDDDDLREAVRNELILYWAETAADLPKRTHPNWLPLP
jgi:hypothetical protein